MREEVISMTGDIQPHYRLEAWKETMALVKSVYLYPSPITHLSSPQKT